jgi:hypothetical protein
MPIEKKTKAAKPTIKEAAKKKTAKPAKAKVKQEDAPVPTRGGFVQSPYEICGSADMQDEARQVNRVSSYPFDQLTTDEGSNSFFVPAHVEREGFVSDTEWQAEQRALQGTVVNRLVGAVRRHIKRSGTDARFSVKRTVKSETKGVRVTRIK